MKAQNKSTLSGQVLNAFPIDSNNSGFGRYANKRNETPLQIDITSSEHQPRRVDVNKSPPMRNEALRRSLKLHTELTKQDQGTLSTKDEMILK